MAYRYSETITLSAIQCAKCSVTFAMPEHMENERRSDHASFYCPNGHTNYFPHKTDAEKYKELMESEQRAAASLRERAVAAERARTRAEASLSRHKKRLAAGVCPCCNRTVAQLANHMKSKHSDFLELQGLTPRKQLAEKVQ